MMTATAAATAAHGDTLIDMTRIHRLEERYPFNEEELEILVRCHEHLHRVNDDNDNDFLINLAVASPYAYFFLPGDEMRTRVRWIEDTVLPAGFANELKSAIAADAFVEYANQGEDKSLERFIEGVASTGRRGSKEALRVLFNLLDQPLPSEVMDICVRLAIACEALECPNLNQDAILARVEQLDDATKALSKSLEKACKGKPLSLHTFVEWAEESFPLISAPLSSFVHTLLFHGHAFPATRIPYLVPQLESSSDIIESINSPLLAILSMTSHSFGGKWHRLYSADGDGRSFDRLEWMLLGYTGPTVLLIQTTQHEVIGALAADPWKRSRDFYGTGGGFLFMLKPDIAFYHPSGKGDNFMYLHSSHSIHDPILDVESHGQPHGLGLGGSLSSPRLFVPESLERCTAGFLDKTYDSGNLLPEDALEQFEIASLEIWGVGGDVVVHQALQNRADYRERFDAALVHARRVDDRTVFAQDLQSGLIPNSALFAHQEQTRGRHDFLVDDEHGGYKLDRK